MPRVNVNTIHISKLQKDGVLPNAINWTSKRNQEIRFKVILYLLPKDLSQSTIVDAGCGYGDIYPYMQKHHRLPKEYIGIDYIEDMFGIAREQSDYSEIIIRDITEGPLPRADYYISSGALNITTKFETFLFIQNCFKASTSGFIFNSLYGDKVCDIYNYLSKKDIDTMVKAFDVKEVIIIDDYLEDDVTIGFFK